MGLLQFPRHIDLGAEEHFVAYIENLEQNAPGLDGVMGALRAGGDGTFGSAIWSIENAGRPWTLVFQADYSGGVELCFMMYGTWA